MRGLVLRPAGATDTGYRRGGRSPVGVGAAIAVHGAALAIFLLMPPQMIDVIRDWKPLVGTNVPVEQPPPPEKQPDAPEARQTQTGKIVPATADPAVPIPDPGGLVIDQGPADQGGGAAVDPPAIPPPPVPVLVDARIDPHALAQFQPDYPPAMIRLSEEGTVTVRVSIGADGRVTNVEKLSATDDAFWLATQRHALRKWRFRPATRDGVAIATSKVMTVHFRLEDAR
jgi:protein TonB